ncbi:Tol biopolymer transport system component [Lewinella marina]|uniref:TolB family protein n=1 Tax=Neolewinella marina TaxID=438751 RepID=UPI00169CAE69|nr:PD40 domain-containing protein [Neolewinella marina]NJB86826.1 Tol biopolymer transport system component [Neolewinella marina]
MRFLPIVFSLLFLTACRSGGLPPAGKAGAAPGTPNGRIAFVSNRSGDYEVYTVHADGSGLTNLTNHPALDFSVSGSPDGRELAFYSDRDGNREIYLMPAAGGPPQRLTDHPAADVLPSFSPDGQLIAFVSERGGKGRDLYRMNHDGSGVAALTDNADYEESPSWSPDGRYILFTLQLREATDTTHAANGEIFRMEADGSKVQ